MPHSAEHAKAPGAVMEREHQIQIGLAQALVDHLEQGGDAKLAAEILDQLVAYSSAHFMSEELLMRLASYVDYDDHVADHMHMMDELDAILELHKAGQAALELAKVRAVQDFLLKHIQTRDARFAALGQTA
ncbi:hypothetical protein EZJ19_02970 [Parasulfuritortus cantonensis]|uniref:Hemerythrin-like domain-containing protein n=1 Tax=Parasulfuritortus cantonensis TaxID=2528202 RepID=A0A4R1BLH8_9PROT|nr:hemerythrin family protein [Parasulfuritortus cantonensis]TCJ18209.1 hypothetical protein EZJ19_02970 [Parasulfuritortus cantonensis]